MAITEVTAARSSLANASRGNFTITFSASLAVGDYVALLAEQDGTANSYTAPANWIAATGSPITGASGAHECCWIYKIQSGDPGNASGSFTTNVSDFSCVVWTAFRGVDLTTPYDVNAGSVTFNASASCVLPSITTVTDGCKIVCLEGEQSVGVTHTGPGTEALDIDGGSIYSFDQASAGLTGTQTITLSGVSGGGGFIIPLRPAPVAPPVTSPDFSRFPKGLMARR